MKVPNLCLLIFVLLVGCTPKASNSLLEAEGESQKIGMIKGSKGTLSQGNSFLEKELKERFESVENLSDYKILSKNPEYYYLTARGTREGKMAVVATELEVKDGALHLETYNKLNHLCFGQYCDGCSFKFNDRGEISGCACDTGDKERPEGMAQCGYTMSIATLEKRF